MAGDDSLRIGTSRPRCALLLAAALGLVALGALILASGSPAAAAVGWAGIAFFGACALALARQLFDARPRIVIDDHGVLDRTLGVGAIPWHQIRDAQLCHVGRTPFIRLALRDERAWVARLRPLQRRLVAANRALGFGSFNLNLSATQADPARVLALVRARAALHREPERDACATVR